LPKPIFNEEGERLPANYANFLIINHAVMVPAYDDPMDAVAAERLEGCFPGRRIILIPCRPLVHQYGSLHCMTMQFPGQLFSANNN
jgi:agmatine/peptidylarginine deiminase